MAALNPQAARGLRSNSGSFSISGYSAPAADRRVLVAVVYGRRTGAAPTMSVSFGGTTMQLVTSVTRGSSSTLWVYMLPLPGSAEIVADVVGTTSASLAWNLHVVTLSGRDGLLPSLHATSDSHASAPFDIGLADVPAGSDLIFAKAAASNSGSSGVALGTLLAQTSGDTSQLDTSHYHSASAEAVVEQVFYDGSALNAVVAAIAFPAALEDFPGDWPHKEAITVPAAKVSGSHAGFPVYLTEANLPTEIWAAAQDGGGDLRFSSDAAGANRLPVDVVSFDAGAQTARLWVRLPALSDLSDTTFWVWWGATSAKQQPPPEFPGGRQEVWQDYEAVYHLTGADASDRTGRHPATLVGSPGSRAGRDGGLAIELDGATQYISLPTTVRDALNGAAAVTVDAWAYPAAAGRSRVILQSWSGGTGQVKLWSDITGAGGWAFAVDTGSVSRAGVNAGDVALNTWQRLVGVYDGSAVSIFKDGALSDTASASGTLRTITGGGARIGLDPTSNADHFAGGLQTVRIRLSAVSSGWIATEYANQADPASFAVPGGGGGGDHYEDAFALDLTASIGAAGAGAAVGSLTLDIEPAVGAGGSASLAGAISMGIATGLANGGAGAAADVATLALSAGMAPGGMSTAVSALAFGIGLGLTYSDGATQQYEDALDIGFVVDMASAAAASAQGEVVLSLQATVSMEGAAAAVATISVALATDLLGVAAADLAAAIALGVEVGQAVAASVGEMTVPDARVFRVGRDRRQIEIRRAGRVITVTADIRRFDA